MKADLASQGLYLSFHQGYSWLQVFVRKAMVSGVCWDHVAQPRNSAEKVKFSVSYHITQHSAWKHNCLSYLFMYKVFWSIATYGRESKNCNDNKSAEVVHTLFT